MGRDQHDDRKRALVMGKYKFLYQDDTEDLEESDKFKLAIVQNKLLGPVIYKDRNGRDPAVMKIYGKEREDIGRGFADPDIKIPGVLKTFTVAWSNPFGDIFLDPDIKLFEFEDIQKYSGYNDGPTSVEFCRFYTSSSSKELDGFDSSIFWSAGLLWKHFSTCGVERWDTELTELVAHYRNWREWSHAVHRRGGAGWAGPEGGREGYTRQDRDRGEGGGRQDRERGERRHSGNNNSAADCPPAALPPGQFSLPPPVLPPGLPPGQPLYLPLAGQNGGMVQVHLVTLPQARAPPAPGPPAPGSRFKYINPHHPPPGLRSASWTNQVDDFLKRPPAVKLEKSPRKRSSSGAGPDTKKKQVSVNIAALVSSGSPPKAVDPARMAARIHGREEAVRARQEGAGFRPRAEVRPPTPEAEAKEEVKEEAAGGPEEYRGTITDWRGKFGFMTSEQMDGRIFVHSKDFLEGRKLARVGAEVHFKVLHQESSVVGAKAVCVRILV